MDLRAYYRRLREVENAMPGPFVVLISLATPDGGKAGTRTEVTRHVAARQVAEGKARLATEEEAALFREENIEAKKAFDQAMVANRMQVVVMPAKSANKNTQS